MINFSFSSVLMTVFISSLLLFMIGLCFRNDHLLTNIGYKLISVFCIVGLLRFLIPLELPFTRTLHLPKAISDIMIVFTRSYGTFQGIDISFGTAFGAVWFLGILLCLTAYIHEYRKLRSIIKKSSKDITSDRFCTALLNDVCTKRQRERIRILSNAAFDTPMIMGLRNPIIILPSSADLSDMDTFYAIRHEICHYTHHDLWIKLAVNILAIVYWWNPFSYRLKRHVDALLEMRVDDSILSDANASADDYVTSLLHFVKSADLMKKTAPQTIGLMTGGGSNLHHRIKMMQHRNRRPNWLVNIAMTAMVFSVYILSYCFIWEVYYTAPEMAESCIVLTDDNCYAIINEDGLYDVYLIQGFYLDTDTRIDTTDTLNYYPAHMRIYSSEEEYYEEKP